MRRMNVTVGVLVLAIAQAAWASDPIGVYALIDRVVMEPSEGSPERVQIYGAFATADRRTREYAEPVRGYLYYTLPSDNADQAQIEWRDMREVAGTGQIIGFGGRYKSVGRVRTGVGPGGTGEAADAAQIELLIAKLNDPDQAVRERATEELEAAGRAAEPPVNRALADKPSAEVKARLERVIERLRPDEYPLGFGLVKVRTDRAWTAVQRLLLTPQTLAPAEGAYVPGGEVKLAVANAASKDRGLSYVFEIEGSDGTREVSRPTPAGKARTEWTPALRVRPGVKYTWRAYVQLPDQLHVKDNGNAATPRDRGPVAAATFRGT